MHKFLCLWPLVWTLLALLLCQGCLHSPSMPASAVLLAVQLRLLLHPDRSIFCCNNRVQYVCGCMSAIILSHVLWSKALTTVLCP